MRRVHRGLGAVTIAAVALSGCAPTVMAPTVPVMPGSGKAFDAFMADQQTCEAYANTQTAPLSAQANNQALGGALLTTALGAGLGAAIGGGRGAAIGAASGAVVGTATAAQGSSIAGMSIQQQYDIFYSQCMSARGNQVPGYSSNMYAIPPYPGYGASPPGPMAPPPPGSYVPPPPPPYR
ncbi:MAG TPA: YMGG-like glycine zipper-containing protein [Stellaceae bacterium]|nr:YMGG-like glycine zipper-containing protein [Stellaceae bacterium]